MGLTCPDYQGSTVVRKPPVTFGLVISPNVEYNMLIGCLRNDSDITLEIIYESRDR